MPEDIINLEEALEQNMPGQPVDLQSGIDRPAEDVQLETEQFEADVQYVLSDEQKQTITEYIVKLVDDCAANRTEWQETKKECLDLLNGIRPPKSDPWENCSNITTMAAATHAKLIHAKLFPTVWNENLLYWRPIEKGDVDNVEKVSKFMKWVLRQDMKIQDIIDDMLWDLVTIGTVALKIRWDTEYRTVLDKDEDGNLEYRPIAHQRAFVDNIPIDEVYLPQLWTCEDTCEFIAQDIYMRLPDVQALAEQGIYNKSKVDEHLSPKLSEIVAESLRSKKLEIEGTTPQFDAHINSYPLRLIECYMKWFIDGEMKESVFTIAYETKTYLSGKPLSAVSPTGKRPWVIGPFIRRSGRPYGISLIELIKGLCKELDAIHNQRIDAGSVSIAPFGFYRAASSFRPEKTTIGPAVMIPVDDINDVKMVELKHNPVASFQEERIIIEYIEKLTSVSAYQMGRESDIVKSRATATGTMQIIGQGEQAFTVLGQRCQNIISRAVTKILQTYQVRMPTGYADRILGEEPGKLLFEGGLKPEEIGGQYDAYMTLDATVGNKAMERQANSILIQMAPNLLTLAQDPRGYEMASEFLKSIGKVEIVKYLGEKPQGKPTAESMTKALPVGPGMEEPGGVPNV